MAGSIGGGINIGPGGIRAGVGGSLGPFTGGVSIGPGGISANIGFSPGIFRPSNRRIGAIIAQVTIDEQERDELYITEFPVEQGAPINDHAYKRPTHVSIRAGWTKAMAGDLSATGGGVYAQLLQWQAAVIPFSLVTGKRTYHDMLIQSLVVTTDQKSEYALMAEIHCQQVIIVATSVTQASISQDPSKQADPSKTSTPSEKGDKQPTPVPGQPQAGQTPADYTIGPSGQADKAGGPLSQVETPADYQQGPTGQADQVLNTVQKNSTPEQLGEKGFPVGPGIDPMTGAALPP